MKRVHILGRPIAVSDIHELDLEDVQQEIKPRKIERLQLRQWRQIKRQAA